MPSSASSRVSPRPRIDAGPRRGLYALGAIGVAAVVALLVFGMPKRLSDEPLRTVPDDAVAVLSVRVHDVLHARFVRDLAGGALDDAGMSRVREVCGFDPLDRVETATVFVSGDEDLGLDHVGFVARGPRLASEDLVRCVKRAVESDGGGMREVRIEGERAIASASGSSRAAFVGSDGVTGGSEPSVAAVLRTFHGDQRSADGDALLHELWQKLASGSRDAVLVAHVPSRWRAALVRRIGDDPRLALLTRVRAVGLSASVATGASVSVLLRTDGSDTARDLVETARALRRDALSNPLATLTPAGRALAGVRLEAEGADAVAAVDLDADEARALYTAVVRALTPEPEEDAPHEEQLPRAPEPEPQPDETLRPARP